MKNTADASLDSRFLTASAEIGVQKVHLLPLLVSEFTFDTLCKVFRDYFLDNSWDDFGKLSGCHWAGVETTDFMYILYFYGHSVLFFLFHVCVLFIG